MRRNPLFIIITTAIFLAAFQAPSLALLPMHPDDVTKYQAEGKYDAMMQQWFDYIEKNPMRNYDPDEMLLIPEKIEMIKENLISDSPLLKTDVDFDSNNVIDERDFLELGYPVERRAQGYWDAPSIGEQKSIVILVDFNDRQGNPAKGTQYFTDLLFSEDKLPTPSMRDFYHELSLNQLDCVGTVADSGVNGGWFRIDASASDYFGFDRAPDVVNLAIDLADPYIDFSEFDNNGYGRVESIMVVVAGNADWDQFWPHKWNLWTQRKVDDVWVYPYFLSTEDSNMGIFAHEHGHAMGLPDLYDYDGSSYGVGYWCLMSYGCWGEGSSVWPVRMSAWCRYKLGWINPMNVTTDMRNVPIITIPDINYTYRLWTNGEMGLEYFLIENRRKSGYDAHIPGEGVLIWHCYDNGNQQNDDFRFVDLEEADGMDDIDHKNNMGDATDPFYFESGNYRFTDYTYPNAYTNPGDPTGIKVCSISTQGEIMYATFLNNPIGVEDVSGLTPEPVEPRR